MKAAYTRIKKPRRVTDDPVIYVCMYQRRLEKPFCFA